MKENRKLQIFLCHASTDKHLILPYHKKLIADGYDVWLDTEKLLPGQDWQIEIPNAIKASDVVIVFLSKNSINREGYVQKEIRFALDVADEKPENTIYIVPVKLEECKVPERLNRWHWVEMYKENGYDRLIVSLKKRAADAYLKLRLIPKLSIKAFGNTQVKVNGKTVSSSDWQTQVARELFYFLVAQSRPVVKEQIAYELWPDLDEPVKIKLRFKNEMYRLRRALGQDVVTFENPTYSFNRGLDYKYDVEEFEAKLSKARSVNTTYEKISLYRDAIELVDGKYLEDMYSAWIFEDRERLHQNFVSASLSLVNLYQKEKLYEDAISICQRVITSDPGVEAAYRLLMQTYHSLGDKQGVVLTYQSCISSLNRLYALLPSKETRELYDKLIS